MLITPCTLSALLSLIASTTTAALIPRQNNSSLPADTACNNSPSLCQKKYSDITHLGAHDSPFLRSASSGSTGLMGSSLSLTEAGNQNVNTTAQLDLGVRLLSAQIHKKDAEWHLCHSSCDLLDAGTLANWLGEVKKWMDSHPNDVVTLFLVNSDNASASELAQQFATAGLDKFAYTPSFGTAWPSLAELITSGKRLVVFVNAVPSATEATGAGAGSETSYLLNEFDYVFENAYNVTTPTGFSCTPDRPPALKGNLPSALQSGKLSLMNHMLYSNLAAFGQSIQTPDADAAKTTNAASGGGTGNLGDSANQCRQQYGGKGPTFILLDFVDEGDGVKVVDGLNGVEKTNGRPDTPQSFTGSASSATHGPSKGLVGLAIGGACALLASC